MSLLKNVNHVYKGGRLLELKKEILRLKYPSVTDEDLNFYDGKENEMMEKLEYKLGKTKEELRNIITAL